MLINKERIQSFIKTIDKKTICISIITCVIILYYINPLINIGLSDWDRTFSLAIRDGISIERRVNNFYVLFFIQIPIIFIIFNLIYGTLFKFRKEYKSIFYKLSILLIIPIVIAYISRYSDNSTSIIQNNMIDIMLSFNTLLICIAVLDNRMALSFKKISFTFIIFVIGIITLNIVLRLSIIYVSIIIMSTLILIYSIIILKTEIRKDITIFIHNYMCFLTWLPAFIFCVLEILYILNEHGFFIMKYYTAICLASGIFLITTFLITFFMRKKQISFDTFAYIGIIVSLGFTKYIPHTYVMQYNYNSYNRMYELANGTVAIDFFKGKFPIIDYFSAHAISDVWTRILYCIIHNDFKGVLLDPYAGLSTIIGLIILFFILKNFFSEETTGFIICLFPVAVYSIKVTGICFISVLMLMNLIKNNSTKNNILFWICILISAFMIYDEGVSLGIACIIAYIIIQVINKKWKNLKKFIFTGFAIGVFILILYIIYCLTTGVSVIGRIKEWMAISINSSSSWATTSFGNPASFAFVLSYFALPLCEIIILIITIIRYIIKKDAENIVGLIIAFGTAQLLYITRMIVFHNLEVCNGRTGVLLNFIHWTISLFALYYFIIKKASEEKKLFVWSFVFGITIILECILVLQVKVIPDNLIDGAIKESNMVKLSNDMREINGKERIVYTQNTKELIEGFKKVFDLLLNEDETFLDFANMTSLYMLTDRQRPFYVAQSPSLLTNLYSQECFLEEIVKYDIPLAIIGMTEESHITAMIGIPHNIRYYKIAEYIYSNYKPLVKVGDFAIWCKKENYDDFKNTIYNSKLDENYQLIDYGYDGTKYDIDDNGNINATYCPYHKYNLNWIPYIWANYDNYNAIENSKITDLKANTNNEYVFDGSQKIERETGNYFAFECNNLEKDEEYVMIVFKDSQNKQAQFEYAFEIKPGAYNYIIRVSQDYFWEAFNINTMSFSGESNFTIDKVRILKGD